MTATVLTVFFLQVAIWTGYFYMFFRFLYPSKRMAFRNSLAGGITAALLGMWLIIWTNNILVDKLFQ